MNSRGARRCPGPCPAARPAPTPGSDSSARSEPPGPRRASAGRSTVGASGRHHPARPRAAEHRGGRTRSCVRIVASRRCAETSPSVLVQTVRKYQSPSPAGAPRKLARAASLPHFKQLSVTIAPNCPGSAFWGHPHEGSVRNRALGLPSGRRSVAEPTAGTDGRNRRPVRDPMLDSGRPERPLSRALPTPRPEMTA